MSGVNIIIKYSMFIFNFLFWLCGVLILTLAILLRATVDKEIINSGDTEISSDVSLNILIAVGAIIMILGFLGCCGAIKENRCMLLLFFIGLLLILLLQITSGILESNQKSESDLVLNETLYENAKLLSETGEKVETFQKVMIEFQKKNKCCGLVNGADDWGTNFEQAYESCKCSSPPDSCTSYAGKHVHKESCGAQIKASILKRSGTIIGLSFGVAVVEILGLVFSMVLYCQIEEK